AAWMHRQARTGDRTPRGPSARPARTPRRPRPPSRTSTATPPDTAGRSSSGWSRTFAGGPRPAGAPAGSVRGPTRWACARARAYRCAGGRRDRYAAGSTMTNDRPADLILSGATVHAGAGTDASPGPADHVAITAGRISAVGTATEARAHAGPNTEVLDVRGAMVVPGFQDAHVHPPHGGLAELRCELHDLLDADAYLAAVAGYATANPSATWI